jgi:hypothetical protein
VPTCELVYKLKGTEKCQKAKKKIVDLLMHQQILENAVEL